MRGFWAKVAAILRSMPKFVMTLVERAGQKFWQLLAVPAEPMAEPTAESVVEQPADDFAAVKRLAGVLAQDRVPEAADLEGVHERTVAWLRSLDRSMLVKVMLAEPTAIEGHIHGRPIRGLVPYDAEAVEEVTAAKSQPRPSERKRTLRDELEAAGIAFPA